MKKIVSLFISFLMLGTPLFAKEKSKNKEDFYVPIIYIYPMDESEEVVEQVEDDEYIDGEIVLETDPAPIRGYIEFLEGPNTIFLNRESELALKLKQPQKIASKSLIDPKTVIPTGSNGGFRFGSEEYFISPMTVRASEKAGNLTFGTMYNSAIDSSQLENATSLFTRYDTKKFALASSYQRTEGTMKGYYSDSFSIIPELKINRMFTLQEVFKTDITTNRKTNELVLSIKPLAYKNNDRLNFEIAAGQTIDDNNSIIKSKVRFGTKFRF